jgi:hypothetical protein
VPKFIARASLTCAFFLCITPVFLKAQTGKDPKMLAHGSNYVQVSAPLAQSIVVKVKSQHDGISKLGLHAVPPGATDNVIIACDIPAKIGKKSSAADLEKLAKATPIAARVDKDQIFDLLIPIADANGSDLGGGFVVMEVPYTKASNEAEALKIGVAVRDEVQRQIPSKNAMYQP